MRVGWGEQKYVRDTLNVLLNTKVRGGVGSCIL